MTEYGVTDEGFVLKREVDIQKDIKLAVDAAWPGSNVSGESGFGQLIGIFSSALGQAWEVSQAANNQYSPSLSRQNNLSSLVLLNKIERKKATSTAVILTLTGTNGTIVPAGSLVSDINKTISVATDIDVTIGVSGSANVSATSPISGPLTAEPGSLTQIDTPKAGWSSVTNDLAAIPGRNTETDEELRVRRADSTASGQGNVEAIYSRLLNIDEVTFSRVYVNETDVIDSRGITPHSVSAVIIGGSDAVIAESIFNTKPAGINTFGNTVESVIDDQGFSYPIRFTRPLGVPIYVEIEIDALANFPDNGADLIKQAIVDYASFGADKFGCTGGNQDGFPPGEDVLLSRLYTPINSVDNHTVVSLKIGKSLATLSKVDLDINFDEISSWSTINIDLTVNF